MGNIKAGKTIAIFSVVYGILNFIFNITGDGVVSEGPDIYGMIISAGLIAIGIVSLIKINKGEKIKSSVITMLVFWFLLVIVSIAFLTIPELGTIMFIVGISVSVTPIVTGFVYLSSLKKDMQDIGNSDEPRSDPFGLSDEDNSNESGTLVEKLKKAEDLYHNGHINLEEYTNLRKKILDENI